MFKLKSICFFLAFCLFACISCQKEEAMSNPVQQEECVQGDSDLVPNIEDLQNDGLRSTWYTYPQWNFSGLFKSKTFNIGTGADCILIIVWNTGSSDFTCTVSTDTNGQEARDIVPAGGSKTFTIYGSGWSSVTLQLVHNGSSFSGVATVSYRY